MSRFLCAFLLLCTCAFAEETYILIVDNKKCVLLIRDDDGAMRLGYFKQVITLDGTKPPTDKPPVVNTEFHIQESVPKWMLTVAEPFKANKKEIAVGLKDIIAEAEDDAFANIGEMEAALGVTIKSVIKEPKEWRAFGASLYASLELLKSLGKINTPRDMGRALNEVVKGLQ